MTCGAPPAPLPAMIDLLAGWLRRSRHTVHVRVLGVIGGRMVRWSGDVRVVPGATVGAVLAAAARPARVDLPGALAAGDQPVLMLDGLRLDLPAALSHPVPDGAQLTWLQPMVGG